MYYIKVHHPLSHSCLYVSHQVPNCMQNGVTTQWCSWEVVLNKPKIYYLSCIINPQKKSFKGKKFSFDSVLQSQAKTTKSKLKPSPQNSSFIGFCFSYSACIRRAAGYCCVQYQVCAGQPLAFTLDNNASAAKVFVDSWCTSDYIAIPGKLINFAIFMIVLFVKNCHPTAISTKKHCS